MFSNALEIVGKFTFPVVVTRRLHGGNIGAALGTFIVVNADGWILTADHILADILKYFDSQTEIQRYEADKKAIEDSPKYDPHEKRKKILRLPVNKDWITDQVILWWDPLWSMAEYFRNELADIALIRLDNFNPALVTGYPAFRNPANPLKQGTSLCRLGHPFHSISATFDSTTKSFTHNPGTFPIPRFPNDGILTRLIRKRSASGTQHAQFIETSTPGLKGQSGGPIFDIKGNVWAIQSQTHFLQLGFSPKAVHNGKEIVEHQFMNLGWGSDIQHAIDLMTANNVAFTLQT